MSVHSPTQAAQHARGRTRLILIALLAALWVLPRWVESDGGRQVGGSNRRHANGRAGGIGALGTICTGAYVLVGPTRKVAASGRSVGCVCGSGRHDILAGDRSPLDPRRADARGVGAHLCPLGALALLDAWYTAKLNTPGYDNAVSRVRGLAASIAAIALAVHGAILPAVTCAWIGLPPLILDATKREHAARRIANALFLAAAIAAGLAPSIHDHLIGADAVVGTATTWPVYGWSILCALLATTTLGAIFGHDGDSTEGDGPTATA